MPSYKRIKFAQIYPIFKCGYRLIISNLDPFQYTLSKILEKAITSGSFNFINIYFIITETIWILKNISTADAILNIIAYNIYSSLNESKIR